MDPIAPTISSNVTGPLGIRHLPRLWYKILLHACGRLPEGYRHGEGGFDQSLTDHFGIDRDAFVAYIEKEKPDYSALEAWVCENAKDLRPQTVAAWNHAILLRNMRDEMASERRERFKIADPTFANAVVLNDLDDWAVAHELLTAATVAP